jgi:polyphosphate kinase 2 (PPK2 family)
MNYLQRFRVSPEAKVKLKEVDAAFKDSHESDESAKEEIAHFQERLRELQDLLYAERRRSLLICLQAMDTGERMGPSTTSWAR